VPEWANKFECLVSVALVACTRKLRQPRHRQDTTHVKTRTVSRRGPSSSHHQGYGHKLEAPSLGLFSGPYLRTAQPLRKPFVLVDLTMNTDNSRPSARSTEDVDAREDCQRQPSGTHTLGLVAVLGISEICSVSPGILCNCRKHKTAEKPRQL
jgi:hypothetical protein